MLPDRKEGKKMKVYVLIGSDPYYKCILGIYSSKEKVMNAYSQWEKMDSNMEYSVEEWEVDKN